MSHLVQNRQEDDYKYIKPLKKMCLILNLYHIKEKNFKVKFRKYLNGSGEAKNTRGNPGLPFE